MDNNLNENNELNLETNNINHVNNNQNEIKTEESEEKISIEPKNKLVHNLLVFITAIILLLIFYFFFGRGINKDVTNTLASTSTTTKTKMMRSTTIFNSKEAKDATTIYANELLDIDYLQNNLIIVNYQYKLNIDISKTLTYNLTNNILYKYVNNKKIEVKTTQNKEIIKITYIKNNNEERLYLLEKNGVLFYIENFETDELIMFKTSGKVSDMEIIELKNQGTCDKIYTLAYKKDGQNYIGEGESQNLLSNEIIMTYPACSDNQIRIDSNHFMYYLNNKSYITDEKNEKIQVKYLLPYGENYFIISNKNVYYLENNKTVANNLGLTNMLTKGNDKIYTELINKKTITFYY